MYGVCDNSLLIKNLFNKDSKFPLYNRKHRIYSTINSLSKFLKLVLSQVLFWEALALSMAVETIWYKSSLISTFMMSFSNIKVNYILHYCKYILLYFSTYLLLLVQNLKNFHGEIWNRPLYWDAKERPKKGAGHSSWVVEFWGFLLCLFVCFNLFNLFLAALGLHCCAQAFSSCGERGLLFVTVCVLLIAVASLVAEHRL